MIDFIAHLSHAALYPTLFAGVIALGGIVLLPAVYLGMAGTINLFHLFLITVFANITSETAYYALGMHATKERLYRIQFVRKRIDEAKRFSKFFEKHGAILVFVSKFVYGTRIAGQVLAGMHRINFLKFLFATTLGSAVWFGIFYALLKAADESLSGVAQTTRHLQFMFLGVALVLTCINLFTGTYVRKRMLARRN
jgi:membrane protein DedA with SNARE-associated domain